MTAGRTFAVERERRANPVAATRCFRFVSRSRCAGHRRGSVAVSIDNRCSDGSGCYRGNRGRRCCRCLVNDLRCHSFFHFSWRFCLDCRLGVNDGGFRLGSRLLNHGFFVYGCRLSGDDRLSSDNRLSDSFSFNLNFSFSCGFCDGLSNDFLRRRLRFAGDNLRSRFRRFGFAGSDVSRDRCDDFRNGRFANDLLGNSRLGNDSWRDGFGNKSLNLRLFLLLVVRAGYRVTDPDFT